MKKICIIIFLVTITLGTKAQTVDSMALAITRTETILDSISNQVMEYQKAMKNPYVSLTRETQLNVLDMYMSTKILFEKFLECHKALQEKNKETEAKLDSLIIDFKNLAKLAKEIAAENKELKKQK